MFKLINENNLLEDKLTKEDRDELDSDQFGIPSKRKYPLNDKVHVIKAIQFFNKCPDKYKTELANNIIKYTRKYKIEIDKSNNIYKYLQKD